MGIIARAMQTQALHSWNVAPEEAIRIQKSLRGLVRLTPLKAPPKVIAGADVSLEWKGTEGFAGIIPLSLPGLELKPHAFSRADLKFPYVPGLLSFREIPLLVEAWDALPEKPDLVMVDGHGIAHPRRMGIATHLGLALNVPTVGCAKSLLVGEYREPDRAAGSWSHMRHKGEIVGAAVRTKDGVAPVFVSPGHLITLEQSIELVLATARGYRLPEPTRLAHEYVNDFRRRETGKASVEK